jgi:hypothetical protein
MIIKPIRKSSMVLMFLFHIFGVGENAPTPDMSLNIARKTL